jgi:hypothetical protein
MTARRERRLPPCDPRFLLSGALTNTNRRDAPIYRTFTDDQRWDLLAYLGALPG